MLRKFHACSVRQILKRFYEGIILILHQECEYIAAGPTAKTVIHLLLLAHRKRGRLLIMEWTESKIRTSLFLKFHIARDYIYNIIS